LYAVSQKSDNRQVKRFKYITKISRMQQSEFPFFLQEPDLAIEVNEALLEAL
jgi:hypothetical protein